MENKFHYRLTAAIMVISTVVIFALTLHIQQLERDKEELHQQLHESHMAPDRCTPVHVTCECPEYDEGWDDAQFAEGCDPSVTEMDIDDLRILCDELDSSQYIPGC